MFHSEGVAGGASIDNLIIKTVLEDMLSFSGGLALDKSSFKFGSKPGFFEVASLLLAASALNYAALACRVAKRALLTAEEFDRRAHKLRPKADIQPIVSMLRLQSALPPFAAVSSCRLARGRQIE